MKRIQCMHTPAQPFTYSVHYNCTSHIYGIRTTKLDRLVVHMSKVNLTSVEITMNEIILLLNKIMLMEHCYDVTMAINCIH